MRAKAFWWGYKSGFKKLILSDYSNYYSKISGWNIWILPKKYK